jgi:phenylacetate-CoA ligase
MTREEVAQQAREKLETRQLDRLRALLGAVAVYNPFYSKRLEAVGVGPAIASLDDFRSRVPFTFKQDLVEDQLAHPPYGTDLTFPIERYSRFHQTSGTTGAPLRWLDTTETWNELLDCWKRVFEAASVGLADRIFFPFSFGPFLGFWAAFEAATRMGCLSIPGGGMRSAARLQTILHNEVTVLCATPTYAIHLAEVAAAEKIDLAASKVRRIIVAGEPGGGIPATRTLIESLWPGARVADHHGMTETGPVSYECPARTGVLHVIESTYLPEVIDPLTLKPVPPGGTGELVITTLGRVGSPLLRYRTRDIVRRDVRRQCECGSVELTLDGGILGRGDDMVVVRGVNIYPSAVEQVLRGCGGIVEFRVEVSGDRALPQMRIDIETEPRHESEAIAQRASRALENAFALRVDVACVEPGALPRFELKAKRWVRR